MPLAKLHAFHTALHQWYRSHGRHQLPWRTTSDPYAIYLSEIMLQQTQVKTVLERFYHPFLARFPSLQALADAPAEQVMKQWEGLGYYSRAANLHKAAQITAPKLPDTYEGLIALPGIGQNTAHAILAFAYHRPVAIMEANVKRLIHRIFALHQATPAQLWEKAAELLNRQHPFDYNQAMMDLGSMICTPRQPACPTCPAAVICKGKKAPLNYPTKEESKAIPVRRKRIVILRDANHRYYLTARTTRFLGGLYGFIEQDSHIDTLEWKGTHYPLGLDNQIGHITQSYSHFTLDADVHLLTLKDKFNSTNWLPLDEIGRMPLSRADSKILALIRG